MADWIVVGAGLTGATLAERIATIRGETVTVVERRPHIGGNAYDHADAAGVLVHEYGPHIFHTNSAAVWDYLQDFTEWRAYAHCVRAVIDGIEAPIPFNFNTIDMLFPAAEAKGLVDRLLERHPYGEAVPVLKLMKDPDPEVAGLASFVYEKVFRNYTFKQWGLLPEALSPSVTARVPIRFSRDDRYFQDAYQAIPANGYTAMIARMLDRPKIRLDLGTDYRAMRNGNRGARTIFTGPIDEFFDYRFGPLPYRSLTFRRETLDMPWRQRVGTVNYPNDHAYTRITEMKHLTGQELPRTTLVSEYPRAHVPGETEPYYPIPRDETRVLYDKYATLARERNDIHFCGRLGDYRYYNMDQAVGAALALFEKAIRDS